MHYAGIIDLGMRFQPHSACDVEASRERVQRWVVERQLTGSAESFSWYCAWDTAGFVGNSYPHAVPGDGMDLVGKLMAVAILLDDQLDELVTASDCVRKIQPFLEIVRGGGRVVAAAHRPLHHAFAEVIRESRARASDAWWRRAALNWEASLIAVAHEAVSRSMRGGPAPLDVYLAIRRGSGFMGPFLDILEPAAGLEPPELAYYSPHLTLMRTVVVDLGNFVNDVFSLDKEIARGQFDNLVLVLCAERNYTVDQAIQSVIDIVASRARRFRELRSELPNVCAQLGLTGIDLEHTFGYADALEMWAGGYEPWHRTSPRYREALVQRPTNGAWAYEELLGEEPEKAR